MKIPVLLALLCGLVSLPACSQSSESELKSLYDAHLWFDLSDKMEEAPAPVFYQAAILAAQNRIPDTERALNRLIQNPPSAEIATQAHELLLALYYRSGRYSDGLQQAKASLSLHPGRADIANILPLLQTLAPYHSQHTVKRSPSTLPTQFFDGNLVLPVTIHGVTGNYIFDNGYSLSGISESEARRLHLEVQDVATHIDTMSGASVKTRIAIAHDLSLGAIQLANVAFYVLPDNAPPFDELPAGKQGIIGLPVILALEHFQWNAEKKTFTILPRTSRQSRSFNLALDETATLIRVPFQGKQLQFSLDLGAQHTVLYPSFAQDFPAIRDSGAPEAHRITGVGGSAEIESVTVPSLTFHVGGQDRSLAPAHILLHENNSTSNWFVGNLGMDLLNGSNNVEIDFRQMKLTIH